VPQASIDAAPYLKVISAAGGGPNVGIPDTVALAAIRAMLWYIFPRVKELIAMGPARLAAVVVHAKQGCTDHEL
jgi:hypothetical protein